LKKDLTLPKQVTVSDLTPREGFQSEERVIPTEAKLFIINGLIDAGFREMEVTAFAPPKYQPQFRDWEAVLKGLPQRDDVTYSCVTTSPKATERAFDAREKGYRVDRILLGIIPGSEKMNKVISGLDYAQAWAWIGGSVKRAHQLKMKVNVFISGIFSPSAANGRPPMEEGFEFVKRLLDMGVDDIEHPDHDGEATPEEVYSYFIRIMDKHADPNQHIFHIHDARGMGLACYFAALMAGITRFETCLGGLGGFPAAFVDGVPTGGLKWVTEVARRPGLVSTEDFLVMLDGMNIETGIVVEKVLNLGKWLERIVGRETASFCLGRGARPGVGRVPK
jgi:hydroxymethylglutaryl-CoA lyase